MTQEEKAKAYDEALQRARKQRDDYQKELNKTDKNSQLAGLLRAGISAIELAFPELAESEDERIRKELKEAFEAYDIESKWNGIPIRSIFAWLEKQKEQKPVSISCGHENDAECIEDSVKFEEGFKAGRESGLRDGQKYVLNNLDSYGLCKLAEWSEEDKEMLECVIMDVESAKEKYLKSTTEVVRQGAIIADKELAWLKALRPQYHGDVTMTEAYKMGLEAGKASSWKPSEEQMNKLKEVIYGLCTCGNGPVLKSLYEDLKKL